MGDWIISDLVSAAQTTGCYNAGGNNIFAARAFNKTAGILAAYPKKVESGKELKSVQGIGKGSQDKVNSCSLSATACTTNAVACKPPGMNHSIFYALLTAPDMLW